MQIAIIDDGIDKSKLRNQNLEIDLFVDNDNKTIKPRASGDHLLTSHGTTCARIIEAYAPEVEFISISVFADIKLKTTCERLQTALSWCMEKRIPLIHMSVGTEQLQDSLMLRPVIARMLMQGQIIVAAGNNNGNYTIPACLGGVIGVVADQELTGFSIHARHSDKGILLAASSRHLLSDSSGAMSETAIANSYAAPTVTAAVYNILCMRQPYTTSVSLLYSTLTGGKLTYQPARADFIEDACVLNLSGKKLLHHRFFFSFQEEYTTLQELAEGCSKGNSLVFLPSLDLEDNNKVMDFIKSYDKQWRGFLFAGRAMSEIIHIEDMPYMEQALLWSEDNSGILSWIHYKEYLQGSLIIKESPIVFIVDDNDRGIDLACGLQELFQKEGYQCLCVSNLAFSYLYGFEYIPPEIQLPMAIQYVNDIYEPDLAVICVERKSLNKLIKQDENHYIIEFEAETEEVEVGDEIIEKISEKIRDESREEGKKQSVISVLFGKKELEDLYQQITGYFI